MLAAGSGTRFGGNKLAATLGGRPVLQHVLDALASAGIADPVVVVGAETPNLDASIEWRAARRVRNPSPELGLSSSIRIGWTAAVAGAPRPDLVIVALGDQPLLDPEVVRQLLAEPLDPARPIVVARHLDGSRNPVRLEPAAAALVGEASGDRGLGPLLDERPDFVRELQVTTANPDIDEPKDLERLIAADWAGRVRANADQVERFRDAPDEPDFYAPVTRTFVADPGRGDDPVVAALLSIARAGDTWLDIGAGAGRYALPLARAVRRVIAIDPSESMLAALRDGAFAAGIENVRALPGRWPPEDALRAQLGPDPAADAAFIAHVSYDIEAIVPFLDAMESAVRRDCVAILMTESPAAIAAPFWPLVHGEDRIALPALPDFLELLAARRVAPEIVMVAAERRQWASREELHRFLRRQLWTSAGSPADGRLETALDSMASTTADGSIELPHSAAREVGVVRWDPPRRTESGPRSRPAV